MKNYPILRFLRQKGTIVCAAAALGVLAILLVLLLPGFGIVGAVIGVVVAAVVYVLARSYIELISLVSEMLAPE